MEEKRERFFPRVMTRADLIKLESEFSEPIEKSVPKVKISRICANEHFVFGLDDNGNVWKHPLDGPSDKFKWEKIGKPGEIEI